MEKWHEQQVMETENKAIGLAGKREVSAVSWVNVTQRGVTLVVTEAEQGLGEGP